MWNRIKAEPALLMAVLKAVLVLALAFGLKLTPDQRDAMMGLAAVIVGLGGVTRTMVTPNSQVAAAVQPKDPQ